MKQKIFSLCTFVIILLACTALFFSGDYVVYILAYIFSFIFLLCYTVFTASTILEKIVQTIIYGLIMAAQIVFDVLVIALPEGKQQGGAENKQQQNGDIDADSPFFQNGFTP